MSQRAVVMTGIVNEMVVEGSVNDAEPGRVASMCQWMSLLRSWMSVEHCYCDYCEYSV